LKSALRRFRVWTLAGLTLVLALLVDRLGETGRRTRGRGATALLIGAYGNGNYGDDSIGIAIAGALSAGGIGRVRIAGRRSDGSRIVAATGAEFSVAGDGFAGLLATYRAAADCQVAVLGGGGLLEGRRDNVHVQRLVLEYVAKLLVAKLRGASAFVHGIGVSPDLYADPLVSRAVVRALRSVDAVSVRDLGSRSVLRHHGIGATLVLDPAFALLRVWARGVTLRPNTVGFVGLDAQRWPDFDPAEHSAERAAELGRLAGLLADCGDASVELHPFHKSDVKLIEDLATSYREATGADAKQIAYPVADAADAFRRLMSCERILTMRFHPALAALAARREVEIIGGLQKLVALKDAVADGDAIDRDEPLPDEFGSADDLMQKWLIDAKDVLR
jgi:polysaccharide pyruvyl transferase WcaK-like protein